MECRMEWEREAGVQESCTIARKKAFANLFPPRRRTNRLVNPVHGPE